MDLYVTRHGQTDFNLKGLICGSMTDIPLNHQGVVQAQALAERIRGLPLDHILVSPLLRARQTASIATAGRLVPTEEEPRLVEQNFGIYEGTDVSAQEFMELRRNFACTVPGGESTFHVVHRVYSLLDELPHRFPNQHVLLVCHGAVARIIHTYFYDLTNTDFFKIQFENCSLMHYTLQGTKG